MKPDNLKSSTWKFLNTIFDNIREKQNYSKFVQAQNGPFLKYSFQKLASKNRRFFVFRFLPKNYINIKPPRCRVRMRSPNDFKIESVENAFSGTAAFFKIILEFILTPFFLKSFFYEKISLTSK